jgi:mannose-6-phosphate isomerase-like protein (cupin superfamily)
MIFVKNLKSVSDQEWATTEKYPGVRWKFLIDADFMGSSSGLSLGFAEIAPGGDLTLHYHSPAEIYVVTGGKGILDKSGEPEEIKKGDVVYIAGNAKHALKNVGTETLEFYWIFPTDRFSEVEYFN